MSQKITIPGLSQSLHQSYAYDSLNRLLDARETEEMDAGLQTWRQRFIYDRFGNRTVDTGLSTIVGQNPTISQANNRIDVATHPAYGYDPAGNLTKQPGGSTSDTMVYDAENRQIRFTSGQAGAITTYEYDGDGRRVKRVSGAVTTVLEYNVLGQLVAECDNSTSPPTGSGGTSYLTADHLGSTRVVTGQDQSVKGRYDYLPFGEALGAGLSGRTPQMGYDAQTGQRQKFTQKERDSESGLDYFLARYYSGPLGRFTSADQPLIGQEPNDPQTWNLYVYTSNNPLNRVDADGQRWFYTQDDKGRITDAQWVNPNEDGTFTSPGEGWIEFIPTKERSSLELYTEGGTKVTYLSENPDGSPRSKTLWTGKVEDASMGIVGLFIPGRLGLKGLTAGASALWAKYLARKAAKEGAESAAQKLGSMAGKTRTQAREALKKEGFRDQGTTGGRYEKWYHPDGSRVQIRPDGEVVRTAPKVRSEGGGKGYRPRIGPDGNPQNLTILGKKSMAKTISRSHNRLLERLATCTLSEMSIEPSGLWRRFHFTTTIGDPGLMLQLFNPALLKVSRTLDDEGHFIVGEVSVNALEDGGKKIFTSLDYGFRNQDGTMASYPSRSLFYFHLEGDVCVDAVCESYEILEEIQT